MKNKKGQGLIEYIILVAFMCIASIGIVSILNKTVNARLTEITYALRGDKRPIKEDDIPENFYERKDLGNFMEEVKK